MTHVTNNSNYLTSFNLPSYCHTQALCAWVTTCYLNTALRDSIYYLPLSFAMVFMMITPVYVANTELHRLPSLESNYSTRDYYISSSVSERFQFLFQASDHYVVKYHTISVTLGFNITQCLQCDDFSFSCICHHFVSLS